MDEALAVKNLAVEYSTAAHATPNQVLKGVSLSVVAGRHMGVVGDSGCGKSTLLRAVLGALPSCARVTSGQIRVFGAPALPRVPGAIAWIPQDPTQALNPRMRVGAQVRECLQVVGAAAGTDDVAATLERAGFTDAKDVLTRHPFELSGGMRQRLLIAMAFALHPKILVADEPTSALDSISERAWIEQILELSAAYSTTLVLVSHDIALVRAVAHDLVVLHEGRVVDAGQTESVLQSPSHEATRRLVDGAQWDYEAVP